MLQYFKYLLLKETDFRDYSVNTWPYVPSLKIFVFYDLKCDVARGRKVSAFINRASDSLQAIH